jgi:hypothetical protein
MCGGRTMNQLKAAIATAYLDELGTGGIMQVKGDV